MDIKTLVNASREAELKLKKELVRVFGFDGKPVKGIKKDKALKDAEKAYKLARVALDTALKNR